MENSHRTVMSDREGAYLSKYYIQRPIDLGTVNLPRTIFAATELNALTLAVYGGLTLFQLPGIQKEQHVSFLRTQGITVELLRLSLGLDSRKKVAIIDILQSLLQQKIITVTTIEPGSDWQTNWFCCQLPINMTGEVYLKGFSRIHIIDWERIKHRITKPADKIKGYAAYLAVQQNIYYQPGTYQVCYQSQSILGATFGCSRYSLARTLTLLEERGVIAYNKVLWRKHGVPVERNVITNAQNYQQLAEFIRANFINGTYVAILA